MNDDELRRRLDALAAAGAPDEDALLDRWEHRTPRREEPRGRTAPVLAGLVAATVLAVVAVGLSGLGDHTTPEARDTGPATTQTEESPTPEARARAALPAPDARVGQGSDDASGATREIGRGRLVVSVPSSWRWQRPLCGDLTESGYFFSVGVFQACAPATNPSVTSVRIDAATAVPYDDPVPDRTAEGVAYGVSRTSDAEVVTTVVTSRDEDARIVVHGSSASVDQIVASLRVLPPGRVAVPELSLGVSGGEPGVAAPSDPVEMERRLERAGLRLRVREIDGATREAYARVRVVPRVGSVVPVGSTVQVMLVGTPGG